MARPIDKAIFTSILDDVSKLRLDPKSLYVTGVSVEDRSRHTEIWEDGCNDATFARVVRDDAFSATVTVNEREFFLSLRNRSSIRDFLDAHDYRCIYLDITGLSHHVWAPLLRSIRSRGERAFCVYVEPGDYQFSSAPTEHTIFDLSDRIQGIAPLPGFVSLVSSGTETPVFVPLLGFEGARFAFTLEEVQPKREDIFPVVGVPGFRAEYPFYTYVGNRLSLWETRSWRNVRFAAANCPFDLYYLLCEISARCGSRRMIVAPIGTKPHALGAILYHMDYADNTEILYDHPVRRAQRTRGTSRVCVYELSAFRPPCIGDESK